jgi:hypothetical protein
MDDDQKDLIFGICALITCLTMAVCCLVEFWRGEWGRAIVFGILAWAIDKYYQN